MELKGKKINFLGDSITEGAGASCNENCYVSVLKSTCELTEARNYGIGGTRFAVQKNPSDEPRFDLDFSKRVHEMDKDADIIVVFGGTNDYGHGDAPLGNVDDRTPDTFYGACHYIMRTLLEKYTDSQAVILTPLHRENENIPKPGTQNVTLKTYVDIIKEVAEYYSLPVLDLYATAGIQPCIKESREKYTADGLHPNDLGHAFVAHKIEMFLRNL